MARTYDVRDPAQYQEYLTDTTFQWLARGEIYLGYNHGGGTVTVYDPEDAQDEGSRAVIR